MPKFLKSIFEKKGISNIIIMLIVGIILLVASAYFSNIGNNEEVDTDYITFSNVAYENLSQNLQQELEEILSLVAGAGQVRVMLSFSTTNELVIAQDTTENYSRQMEEDGEGGSRQVESRQNSSSYVALRQNNNDVPLVVQEILPSISGVIIVAEGGSSPAIREALTRATSTVLGIWPHQVQVFQMGNN